VLPKPVMGLECMYALRCADFGLTESGPGGVDLARACRLVGMEGDAPPEGGLGSPVNATLPPESGGSGTELNTFNDTPGNTTHGTSHYNGSTR
jgi:hypothetical protein